MRTSVGIVNLGCPKNQVDAELLLAKLKDYGMQIKDDAALADIAIVNTCGFIASARQESFDEIRELAQLKAEGKIKAIVVTGCLAEREREKLMRDLPEIDAVLGIGANADIASHIAQLSSSEPLCIFPDKTRLPLQGRREALNPSYFAYLKIAEGCDNHCTYCAIPSIRGPFRSRSLESIEAEARELVDNGAKELILVAQDTTRYGVDLYGGPMLPKLLTNLCKIDKLRWLRTLYCYPEAITDELLEVVAQEEKIVNYFDLPIQHVSDSVLKRMNRKGNADSLRRLISKIRNKVSDVAIRTTLITGFPGETDEDFEALHRFVKEMRFDHLGCFPYSAEAGTPAMNLPNHLDEETKLRRAEILVENQMDIMQAIGEAKIGSRLETIVEGFDRYAECWFGRSRHDAPEIDGKVFFQVSKEKPTLGSIVCVEIDDCIDGDLFGNLV